MDEGYPNEILAQDAMQRLTPEQRLAAAQANAAYALDGHDEAMERAKREYLDMTNAKCIRWLVPPVGSEGRSSLADLYEDDYSPFF